MVRRIIIHSIEHAKAALSAATTVDCHVVLISAPGAAVYLGGVVFKNMVDEAARHYPDAKFTAVLDCEDNPGLALGALRHGIKSIKICVSDEVKAKIADIAAQSGGVVYQDDGDVLDMLEVGNAPDALETCRLWLNNEHDK